MKEGGFNLTPVRVLFSAMKTKALLRSITSTRSRLLCYKLMRMRLDEMYEKQPNSFLEHPYFFFF